MYPAIVPSNWMDFELSLNKMRDWAHTLRSEFNRINAIDDYIIVVLNVFKNRMRQLPNGVCLNGLGQVEVAGFSPGNSFFYFTRSFTLRLMEWFSQEKDWPFKNAQHAFFNQGENLEKQAVKTVEEDARNFNH